MPDDAHSIDQEPASGAPEPARVVEPERDAAAADHAADPHASAPAEPSAPDDEGEADSDEFRWPEYLGETRPRSRLLAAMMTLVAPGLGYVYLGRFVTGMAINLVFLTAVSAFIIGWTIFKFFPLWPALVCLLSWVAVDLLIVFDLLGRIRRERPFVLRPTNHWIVYASVLVFTFVVPLALTIDGSMRYVWQRTWAGNDAMYPTAVQGDLILVDRTAFVRGRPHRGDLVLVEESGEAGSGVYFARVVGVGPDRVHMEGSLPWVNGRQLGQHLHGAIDDLDGHPPLAADFDRSGMVALFETPYGFDAVEGQEPERWYMIVAPAPPVIEPTEPVELGEGELFALVDNRAMPFGRSDERLGGRVVEAAWIVGRPLFVLLSVAPEDGAIRWERIGLRLQ